ncbi:zinc ribbon domain-containing protein [Candidatus Saccharibacteria bacterium]|nr:zinc ribbon domain-containing protein [Candidatus Saccharibacteria bacterium]HPG37177.1 zinc ribbon domain-containing protein [Candidatus Saccharibacteria bacterium]
MSKQCQSCGMPLKADVRALEKDGSPSSKWCKLCYQDGEFIGGDCTLDQMHTIVDDALKAKGSGRLMRWMAQKQLPRLERWKATKND